MRNMVRYGIILTLICVVSGVSLSFVYSKTSVIIAERQAQATLKAMAVVLPSATDFETLTAEDIAAVSAEAKGVIEAYRGKAADGTDAGAVVKVEAPGYGGTIVLLIGMDTSGTCQGVQVISQSETAGLGSLIKEEAFTGQFAGKSGSLAIKKLGGEIDQVSGATISSRAAVEGVNNGLTFSKALLGM